MGVRPICPICHETMDVAQIYVFGRLRRILLGTGKQKWSMTVFLRDVSVELMWLTRHPGGNSSNGGNISCPLKVGMASMVLCFTARRHP